MSCLLAAAVAHALQCPLRFRFPPSPRCSIRADASPAPRPRVFRPTKKQQARTKLYTHTLKNACNSAEVERLLTEHEPKNVKEYSMGITAYGRSCDWRKALELFEGMLSSGVQPDAITFTAAISACAKGGAWELALSLLEDMRVLGVQPTVV